MPSLRRNLAVDAFRGLTLALMVMVNNPGDYAQVYAQLRHSDWNGFTATDFVFPFFLLIVGVSVAFSLEHRVPRARNNRELLLPVFSRTLKLVSLGLLDNAFPYFDLRTWRIPGVLQRIGVVYCLSTLVAWRLRPRTLIWLTTALLLGYWGILVLIPVPGVGRPDLASMTANLAAWLDQKLMAGHLFIPGEEWDPEGLLSTIPALALTLIGVLTGQRLLGPDSYWRKIRALWGWAVLLLIGGYVWGLYFPFNRWLWTSSFMLFVSGAGLFSLGLCMLAAESRWTAWMLYPFQVLGANAITVYLASDVLAKALYVLPGRGPASLHQMVYARMTDWLSGGPQTSLAWAVGYTLVMLGLAWGLHARRIYIKV